MRRLDEAAAGRIREVISAHDAELRRLPNYLGAEPGFPVVEGRLVREPALIVFVSRKLPESSLAEGERAPRALDGVRVDVVEADPFKQVELDPRTRELSADLESDAALAGLAYEGLPGDPIDSPVEIDAPILCQAGPDVGWVELKKFLEGARERLTVCMYDFSATYISNLLIDQAEAKDLTVKLTLDDHVDETKEQPIQERLKEKLGAAYDTSIVFCRALARFPSAYHPKVAVRDGEAFWLSSGNWTPRSQPEIDPVGKPGEAKGMYSRGNREWHVIVEDRPLAELFERYILHDKTTADDDAALGAMEPLAFPDLFVSLDDLVADQADAALATPDPVKPERLPATPRKVKVRPLLSPDNYARRISEWIRAAQRSLYLQYSYVTCSKAAKDRDFRALLDDLGELSWRDDFDLRIIMGSTGKEKARVLAQEGFNEKVLKVQSNVHNKGIVRDGTQVLVSSQNWSGDGFLRNRDAGLIIEDPDVAGYYQRIFLDDWDTRARDPFATADVTAVIAPDPAAPPPPGMVRMTWADFFGE